MIKVCMLPTPNQASVDNTNSIHQIVLKLSRYLPNYGVLITDDPREADLVVSHAGQVYGEAPRVDVSHCHGLYPTAMSDITSGWHFAANKAVIYNLICAKRITVPSQWIADIIRRDMHVEPDVVPWAIDVDEWDTTRPDHGFVLWNKTRVDGVCSPQPLEELARRLPHQPFISTFGQGKNVQTIGRVPFEEMKEYVQCASVYLATTKETFGLGTLEAMASGVPILGFRFGATPDIVRHGVEGYLVAPGDYDGLVEGLQYCLQHRAVLGANARIRAAQFSWDAVAERFAAIYREVHEFRYEKKVSVVIPCYNYGRFVQTAIESAAQQVAPRDGFEVIVVDDASTDHSAEMIGEMVEKYPDLVRCISQPNSGVAEARNNGIRVAKGEYIVCLDADDMLGHEDFVRFLASFLDEHPTVGVAYTKLRMMDEEGTLGNVANWPNNADFDQQVQGQNRVPTCCMFRKEAWRRAGGYRARYTPAEDAELWLRIGSLGYEYALATTEPWFIYRLHGNSLSTEVRTGQRREPDWLSDKPWIKDGMRPFASAGKAPRMSYPVRNYDKPRISVVIPVGPAHTRLVQQAIDSVESQTERQWECIVVNDSGCPLDLSAYPYIRLVDTGGYTGAAFARNRGVEAASAPLVAFLDADDVFDRRYMEAMLRAYAVKGDYIYCDWLSHSKTGDMEVHETDDFDLDLLFKKASIHSINVLISRTTFLEQGGFDENMQTWEDVEFFMRLASRGICGHRHPEPLVTYRYSLGTVREFGESRKEDMIQYLVDRYGNFMKGESKVCCGNNKPKPQNGMIVSSGGIPLVSADLVRIEYQGATGVHDVIGPVTRQRYGRRSKGDVFYVYLQDQRYNPTLYVAIPDITETMEPTPVPAPPVYEVA